MKKNWLEELFPKIFKKQENPQPAKTSDDFIAEYLQDKQANGESLNAKDYFAKDALDGVATQKLIDALKKALGCEKIEPRVNAVCKDWNDVIKCVSVSVNIFDCLDETVMVTLAVDGEADVIDWVDVWIGEVNEPDVILNLDAYPDGATDSNFIYENTSQKVTDFLLTKMV